MSASGVSLRGQVGAPSWAPAEPARIKIDSYHIGFARDRRPRVSWQALGQMLGVNSEDLRMAVEGGLKKASVTTPAPAPDHRRNLPNITRERPKPPTVLKGSMEHLALINVSLGFGKGALLAGRINRTNNAACSLLKVLRIKGVAELSGDRTVLTQHGKSELARLADV